MKYTCRAERNVSSCTGHETALWEAALHRDRAADILMPCRSHHNTYAWPCDCVHDAQCMVHDARCMVESLCFRETRTGVMHAASSMYCQGW